MRWSFLNKNPTFETDILITISGDSKTICCFKSSCYIRIYLKLNEIGVSTLFSPFPGYCSSSVISGRLLTQITCTKRVKIPVMWVACLASLLKHMYTREWWIRSDTKHPTRSIHHSSIIWYTECHLFPAELFHFNLYVTSHYTHMYTANGLEAVHNIKNTHLWAFHPLQDKVSGEI